MDNKLFLVCPFSTLEPFIKSKYGNEAFFLTAPAGLFRFQEEPYLQEVKRFIKHHRTGHIYIVNDTSCRFLNGIINNQLPAEVAACEHIRSIYHGNLRQVKQEPDAEKQVEKLAELCIQQQTAHLVQPHVLGEEIKGHRIQVKGLITNRRNNDVRELDINLMFD